MIAWSKDEPGRIAAADDLYISPLREDGATPGTPTWIWSVAIDNERSQFQSQRFSRINDLSLKALSRPRPAWPSGRPAPICRQPAVTAPLAHHVPESWER
jgi:hypothetical protein